MDELIRSRMHDALDVEPSPAGLRHTVIWAVPMDRPASRMRKESFQWAGGLVAALLAIAVVIGLMYSRGLIMSPVKPMPAPPTIRFMAPEGVAIAPDGSVYIADEAGLVLQLRPDGSVRRVAGGGSGGDGKAVNASLQHLVGIAVDRNGYIYVAEAFHGHVSSGRSWPGDVRRIDPAGAITTLAGSPALQDPTGLALDSVGTLYFSDFNGTLGRFDRYGNIAWLDSPSLAGPVASPGYLAFDAAGNLYFSDRAPVTPGSPGGCRIVRMTPNKVFTVVAGTGVCGMSGDGGPATSAMIDDPGGIAFDSHGNVYFADSNNHRVRRIDANGMITTVVGTGAIGIAGDGGPAKTAHLTYPFGLAIAGDLLYIGDATCNCETAASPGRIRLVNLTTGVITTVVNGLTPIQTG
jgi:sugar lactone lactonase YvrE